MTTPQTGKRRSLSVTLAQLSRLKPFSSNSPPENGPLQSRIPAAVRRNSYEGESKDQLPINSAGDQRPTIKESFRVGVTEDKNRKCRRTMEDTHSFLYNFMNTEDCGYFAIFDGHAGRDAAEYCGSRFHIILADIIRRNPERMIPDLLDASYTYADAAMEKMHFRNQGCTAATAILRWEDRRMAPTSLYRTSTAGSSKSGIVNITSPAALQMEASVEGASPYSSNVGDTKVSSTPSLLKRLSSGARSESPGLLAPSSPLSKTASRNSVSSISTTASHIRTDSNTSNASTLANPSTRPERKRVLYTANAGDARIVLCRGGKAVRLSYDHKGSDPNEGRRVTEAGGTILNNRVNGVLAVTRALGDAYMKELVTGHPYTTETVLIPGEDEFFILACDGLWDVCTDQTGVDLIRAVEDPHAASKVLVDYALKQYSTDNLTVMVVRLHDKRPGAMSNLKAVDENAIYDD